MTEYDPLTAGRRAEGRALHPTYYALHPRPARKTTRATAEYYEAATGTYYWRLDTGTDALYYRQKRGAAEPFAIGHPLDGQFEVVPADGLVARRPDLAGRTTTLTVTAYGPVTSGRQRSGVVHVDGLLE